MKSLFWLPIALSVVITGCQPRDTSTPSATLVGHWVSESAKKAEPPQDIHSCYSADGQNIIHNKTEDVLYEQQYQVVSQAPAQNSVTINWSDSKGKTSPNITFLFSKDGKTARMGFEDKTLIVYSYVDRSADACGR